MDERAKNKRKLREMEQDEEQEQQDEPAYEPVDGVEPEKPGQGLKKPAAEPNKKQRVAETAATSSEPSADPAELSKKEQKKAAKKEKRKDKKGDKKTKESEQSPADSTTPLEVDAAPTADTPKSKKQKGKKGAKNDALPQPQEEVEQQPEETSGHVDEAPSLDPTIDFSGLQNGDEESGASMPESEPQSPTFDTDAPSATTNGAPADSASTSTSISSTIPPSEKPKHIKIPADTSALRERLAAKIAALRLARKADGPDGKPIRTRQELIESRRAKADQRKEHKKELRKQAKLEEQQKREEALASNSPSVMSPAVELDEATGNFAFGRVAFDDGTQLSHDLSYILQGKKKGGPSDAKTALLKVQNQKKRIEELDEEKRKDIAEKESWLTARRRVEGEKIRDDEAMLKKAIKRKEAAKKKSEKAWSERAKGVSQAQRDKQRKREENLKKRRDDKALGKAGKKKKGGAKKKGGRPGFEGSLGVGGRRK